MKIINKLLVKATHESLNKVLAFSSIFLALTNFFKGLLIGDPIDKILSNLSVLPILGIGVLYLIIGFIINRRFVMFQRIFQMFSFLVISFFSLLAEYNGFFGYLSIYSFLALSLVYDEFRPYSNILNSLSIPFMVVTLVLSLLLKNNINNFDFLIFLNIALEVISIMAGYIIGLFVITIILRRYINSLLQNIKNQNNADISYLWEENKKILNENPDGDLDEHSRNILKANNQKIENLLNEHSEIINEVLQKYKNKKAN